MEKYVRKPPPSFEEKELMLVAGGEVDEYHLSLRSFGDDLVPEEVTALLGCPPSSSCRKGDIFRGKKGERVEPHGRWLLKAPISPGEPFEEQVTRFLAPLSQDLDVWRSLTSRFDADLFCGVWLRHWNRGMDFSPELMLALSSRGLAASLDIYFDNDD